MRRTLSVVGILALAGTVLAAQAATTQTTKQATKTETATKATKAPVKPTATGTIDKFENNILTVTTKKGPENFTVATETVIQEAGKKVEATNLKAGEKVTVRYTEASGTMTATNITISKAAVAKKAPVEKAPVKK
jgi:NAD(P)H-dependent flavin oxidoreductase YrpB (nitropropane dioxygenase family)